jgi:YidC/Oxa1 family membrane protein insertase
MYVQQKMVTPRPPAGQLTQQQLQQQQTQQMMTWMLPLMFGFWSLNVPAGLALYWFVSNLAGIILQYFYLGRKVDWGSMLRLGPAQPQQPARKPKTASAVVADPPRNKKQQQDEERTADGEPPADGTEAQPAAVSAGGAQSRRKRNGRRRGKR